MKVEKGTILMKNQKYMVEVAKFALNEFLKDERLGGDSAPPFSNQ